VSPENSGLAIVAWSGTPNMTQIEIVADPDADRVLIPRFHAGRTIAGVNPSGVAPGASRYGSLTTRYRMRRAHFT
jgi:hypothetical protein